MFADCKSSPEEKAFAAGACAFVGAMAAAKIKEFLCGDNPRVLALTGPAGCGKRYTIAEAARQAGVAVTHHDLSQGAVDWGRLGKHQLTDEGLLGSVHVISNASEDFLKEFAFVKKTQAKIILVADDASQSMRASVPVVRMQPLSTDAMTKKLFLELDWPAEDAVRVARLAKGDWHQVHAQRQFACHVAGGVEQSSALDACSSKDENLANEPPCLIANRLLNGTSPQNCPLDSTTMAWVERNHAAHCEDLETLAQRQEMLAMAAEGFFVGCPASEELFKCAVGFRSKRVHYRSGLYKSPWEKDDGAVCDVSTSFKKQRSSFSHGLKERARQEEAANACECCGVARGGSAAKSRATPKRKPNNKSAPRPKQISSQSYATPHKKAGNEKCAG